MSKAYDLVEWSFIEKLMLKLGFRSEWENLVMDCVWTMEYSVCLNCAIGSAFHPSRGLRQGDPLSLYLFLFSSVLKLAKSDELTKGVRIGRSNITLTHLFFADDSILFSEVSLKGALAIKEIIKTYEGFQVR